MTLLKSLSLPLGTDIIHFSLPDAYKTLHSDEDYNEQKILVIMFICNHCPYVRAIRKRLIALQSNYNSNEVRFIGINANDAQTYPDDSPEMMKQAIEEHGINFPYLFDETQEVARAYQAQCTPDIYVFDQNRKLAYHGRLDDNWQNAEKVTKQELKEAIDNLLRGKPPSENQIPCQGCSIKWKT